MSRKRRDWEFAVPFPWVDSWFKGVSHFARPPLLSRLAVTQYLRRVSHGAEIDWQIAMLLLGLNRDQLRVILASATHADLRESGPHVRGQ